MEYIGRNVKRFRKEKQMTIADLTNEHISAGMISLIENNKTKPSVERLQHIANNLGVSIHDLLAKYSRKELREKIEAFEGNLRSADSEVIARTLGEMAELLPYLGDQYEAAKIYELLAHYTYYVFLFFPEQYEALPEQDWEGYAYKAIKRFERLQMEWRTLNMKSFLANAQILRANYDQAIQIIDEAIRDSFTDRNRESQAVVVDLLYLKSGALDSKGKRKEAHEVIDQAISRMKDNFLMHRFFELSNMKILFLYDEYKFEEARERSRTLENFVKLMDNVNLRIEMMTNQIHHNEFYEGRQKKTYELIAQTKNLLEEIDKEEIPRETLKNLNIFLKDAEARCLTQEGKYEEAIAIFEEYEFVIEDHISMTPLDLSLRKISKSYLARCYFHVGRIEEAKKLAREVVNTLRSFPHTSYFMFAREVLKEVSL